MFLRYCTDRRRVFYHTVSNLVLPLIIAVPVYYRISSYGRRHGDGESDRGSLSSRHSQGGRTPLREDPRAMVPRLQILRDLLPRLHTSHAEDGGALGARDSIQILVQLLPQTIGQSVLEGCSRRDRYMRCN